MEGIADKDSWFKGLKTLFFIAIISLLSLSASAQDGKALFKANCAACHALETKLVGPAIGDISNKLEGKIAGDTKEWLHKWIKNSTNLIESGDAYANKVFEENLKVPMTPFEALKEEEIDAIINYMDGVVEEEEESAASDNKVEVASTGNSGNAELGKKLFKANCAACHALDAELTGPALRGVEARLEGVVGGMPREWLHKWIKNNIGLRESGDAYAQEVFDKYGGVQMNVFPTLSEEDIDAIIDYTSEEKVVVASTETATTEEGSDTTSNDSALLLLVGIAILLFIMLVVLSSVWSTISGAVKEKFPELGNSLPEVLPFEKRLKKSLKSTTAKIIFALVVLSYISVWTFNGAASLATQEGYMPEQPIKFSHKLHVTGNKIDCKYCHIGAEKGRHAVIPSVNICMNCHKAVKVGPVHGEAEIAKIYDAFENKKTVKWIKVHNLPDHVYFNHSQHVMVGKVECETCHGNVGEMEEIKQVSPLGMGWCINCHRETKVQFKDNDFYNTYESLHEKLKNKEVKEITVDMIGGTECQKCHY